MMEPSKMQKLLALTASPNEHEAGVAASRLCKELRERNVNLETLLRSKSPSFEIGRGYEDVERARRAERARERAYARRAQKEEYQKSDYKRRKDAETAHRRAVYAEWKKWGDSWA